MSEEFEPVDLVAEVQNGVPQVVTYTLFQPGKVAKFDCTGYVSVQMLWKQRGNTSVTVLTASIINIYQVRSSTWTPPRAGVFYAQFKLLDGSGNPLYTQPFAILVKDNVDLL